MIKEISPDVVFVKGARCSAIYDFTTNKVYSINDKGTIILSDCISKGAIENQEEYRYVKQVKELVGIPLDFPFQNLDISPAVRSPKLTFVWLELTQKCNSRCIHCYEGQNHHECDQPLNENEWFSIIDELVYSNCSSVQFIGGEPTLNPNLIELIRYSYKCKIKNIQLFSNLSNLTPELLTVLLECNVTVKFSIYGSSAIVHDSITQIKGSFSKLCENLSILLNNQVPLQANVVIMKENEQEYQKIQQFLLNIGIPKSRIKFDEIRKVTGGCQNEHLVTESKCLRKAPNFRADKDYFSLAFNHNTCWYGKIVISTEGSIFPCEFEREISYGNIRNQSLIDIINNEETLKYWNYDYSKVKICKDCEFRYACKDCRPLAKVEKQDLADKNKRCLYNPYLGIWENGSDNLE